MTTQQELQALRELRAIEETNAQARLALSHYERFRQDRADRKELMTLKQRLQQLKTTN